ncbi:MAG TPA: sugar ABC transporter permease [Micromonosporaceae bacterium]|nr:sugar ABC transporter permease [Micromonosporaceae bacterium]
MVATTTQPTATTTTPTPAKPRKRVPPGLLFVVPFLVAYAMFLIWPVISGLWMSFFNNSLTGSAGEFVGLQNWQEVFNDSAVWTSLWHTLYFTLLSTPPLVILGLGMALLTNMALPATWLWRMSFFAPFLLPASVVALIWVWIYQPGFGLINGALSAMGFQQLGWLTDPDIAMISIVITTVWWTVGFNFLLYLAGLQSIPQDVYDAASVDGANGWSRLWRITIPMLNPITGLVIALQALSSLRVFDQIYLMTQGGPNFSTRPVLEYVYDIGFTDFRIGYASAISYLFFAIILIVSITQFKLMPTRAED